MIVTFSSVGFGDLSAVTLEGRIGVILSILTTLALLPTLTSSLIHSIELKSNFARLKFERSECEHIVMSGDIKFNSIVTFLTNMYHQDHGNQET
jgi:hypothetical protein